MTKSTRGITFTPQSAGALLAETTRAYLHGSNPSCIVERVAEGMRAFIAECPEGSDEYEDANILLLSLDKLHRNMKNYEDEKYAEGRILAGIIGDPAHR